MTAQILVVDDEPDMKALVLQKFRHQIGIGAISFLFASDGVEALAMLEGERRHRYGCDRYQYAKNGWVNAAPEAPGKRGKRSRRSSCRPMAT